MLYFNQKIDNLPKKLTKLILADCFNQKIDNLPQNLTFLNISTNFKQKIDNLPKNLTYLYLDCRKYHKEVYNLPKNLTLLAFYTITNNKISIPKNVAKLALPCNNNLINNLSTNIEKLFIHFETQKIKVENLPSTIKEIIIKNYYESQYIKMPFGCIITKGNYLY